VAADRPARLLLVVRADLPPAQQAVQAVHAARAFAEAHPEAERAWHANSNTIALLSVPDEAALLVLLDRARVIRGQTALFREPDLDSTVTAIALAPELRALTKGLPRALEGQ